MTTTVWLRDGGLVVSKRFWTQGWWSDSFADAIATAKRIGAATVRASADGLTPDRVVWTATTGGAA